MADDDRQLCGVRILVVEDDADWRALLRMALEEQGATVSVVDSAFEALLEVEDFLPDVLVSDVAIAERSGLDMVRLLALFPRPFARPSAQNRHKYLPPLGGPGLAPLS